MNTPRAYEEVQVQLGVVSLTLRPTMRAACSLEADVGFEALFRHLGEFRLSTIRKILTATADRSEAAALMKAVAEYPLGEVAQALTEPLTALCAGFLPRASQDEKRAEPTTSAKPLAWSEVYRALISRATGWLHWTPEATWNATPTEIAGALEVHLEMLKAIHGSADDDMHDNDAAPAPKTPEQRAQMEAEGLDPDFDREGLRKMKARLAGGLG